MGNCKKCRKAPGPKSCLCNVSDTPICSFETSYVNNCVPQGTNPGTLAFQNGFCAALGNWQAYNIFFPVQNYYVICNCPNGGNQFCSCPDIANSASSNFMQYFVPNVGPYLDEINTNQDCFPASVMNPAGGPSFSTVYSLYNTAKTNQDLDPDICAFLLQFVPFFNNVMNMTSFTSTFIPGSTPQAPSGTLLNQQQQAFFNAMQTWPGTLCHQDCSDNLTTVFKNTTGPALNNAFNLISQNLAICYTTAQIEQFRSLDTTLQAFLLGSPTADELCDFFTELTDTFQAFNYQFMLSLTSCPG